MVATDHETRQRTKDMRSVLFMEAEGLIARNPRALERKDWLQNPTCAGAQFRSFAAALALIPRTPADPELHADWFPDLW
jgi:hypothetical protein